MCWSSLCVYCPAAGSGIPEVKAYLNGVDAHSILAPSTLFVKIFGSIFGVAVGFVVGKEGPMVHMGACIANLLGQGASTKYHLTWTWLRYFKNDRDRRDLITCGAAAGVAAAFRSPVGGVLFALEEAASWWRSALLWRAFFTTVVVAVVLKGLIEYCKTEQCRLIGEDGLIMRDINNSVPSYNTIDLLAIVLLGVTGGVFRIIYNYLVDEVFGGYNIKMGPGCSIGLTKFDMGCSATVLVMEYASGGELFDRICNAGRFNEDEARFFFQQLISGVSYCHSMQVCHRDLKLENTLLDGSPAPRLKICDFGYSKSSVLHSQPKSTVGTPAYIAPEVLLRQEYDGKAGALYSRRSPQPTQISRKIEVVGLEIMSLKIRRKLARGVERSWA
ncbi:putative protein kinase CAMK-OST1L family [Helianthus annuus]|uniref:Protein kinase domain-containing protein n=2 Tax=Helianthus annuus TaxID=4232 RepID=A0A9K3MVN2_HELAN|nr:putative protein kinase CAMK-OST1L family [Helianthus annuus]